MTDQPERVLSFPLPTHWQRPYPLAYRADAIPVRRQVEVHLPPDFDSQDVDRSAEVLRTCIDNKEPA